MSKQKMTETLRTREEIKEMYGKIEKAEFDKIAKGKRRLKKGIGKDTNSVSEDYIRGLKHGLQFALGIANINIFHEKGKRD